MSTQPPEPTSEQNEQEKNKHQPLYLAGFAIVTIGILVMAIFLSIITLVTVETPTPVPSIQLATPTLVPFPTPQPSITPTYTPTATQLPTFTPEPISSPTTSPTNTLTPTSTPTPAPGLTPAYPLENNEHYHLAEWTPALATKLISYMEAYPDSLSAYARGADNSGYYEAFSYAILSQREALLQFPSAPEADDWAWSLAYNLARTNNPLAGDYYAALISDALNNNIVTIQNLNDWDKLDTYNLSIEIIPFVTSLENLSNNLIKVTAGTNGSTYFWLIETELGFESYPLASFFDFIYTTTVDHTVDDLTGDGGTEVAIYRSPITGDYFYTLPRVFNLNTKPPIELPFEPYQPSAIGPDFVNTWVPVEIAPPQGDLQFKDKVFPPCPVTVQHIYAWKTRTYSFFSEIYVLNIDQELLNYCEIVVDHSTNVWGLDITVKLMEEIFPYWPPETDVYGDPYPPDALDEWRYRLGLYHALLGQVQLAKSYMEGIVNFPSISNSSWIIPSQEFLDTYQNQRDIYKACLPSSYCDPQQALISLVDTFTAIDYQAASDVLKDAGVTVRSHGYFDFDLDGVTEQWFIIRHYPSSKLEFWIMSRIPNGVTVLFLEYVSSNQPGISYLDPDQTPPLVLVEPDITFIYDKQQSTHEPFITFVEPETTYSADLTENEIISLENALLLGTDPALIRDKLLELAKESFFTCNYVNCPHYLFILGLANELSGYERDAVDAYLEVWRNYPSSPYTTMARMKLEGEAVPPTQIPSSTPTVTITPTLPPTSTGTLSTSTPPHTPTITTTPSTATPSTAVTPTVTSTKAAYPAPSQTQDPYP
jgi:hypothetical protein